MAPPRQKPYRSEQTVETPREFLDAVERRFGSIDADLACSVGNAKAPIGYYFPQDNALEKDWVSDFGCCRSWINPPYENIGLWAAKCAETAPRLAPGRLLLLVPASVGSEWFRKYVHGHAYVLALSPRLTFVGHTHPYPKDLMLCVYGGGLRGFDCWRWK